MQRKFIFMDPAAGEELVMPVTPEGYEIEHGRKVNSLTMHTVGAVNLPGSAVLLDQEIEFLLPAHDYPFNQPGTNLNPFVYLEKLEKWSDAGTVLRFVVSDTPVNAAVLLDPIRYREQDGTNDIYVTVPIRGYRQLAVRTVQGAPAAVVERAADGPAVRQTSYTVVRGDTLSGICRRFYGDSSAAMVARVAAHNGIKNVNLIHPGQVLRLPDAAQLPAASTGNGGAVKRDARTEAASRPEYVTVRVTNTRLVLMGSVGRVKVRTREREYEIKAMNAALEAKVLSGGNVTIGWDATGGHELMTVTVDGEIQNPTKGYVSFNATADTWVVVTWLK